jgi:transposase
VAVPTGFSVPPQKRGHCDAKVKRLEAGVFRFPAAAEGQASVTVRAAELAMLLDGVDWQNAKRSERYHRPATATG